MVGCYIGRGEQSFACTNFTMPPVLVSAICDSYDISSPEFQFSSFLRCEIIQCLNQAL